MHQLELTQPYALISVYYKNAPGFDDLVRAIHKSGRLIISTGGTAEHIRSLGIPVIEVSDITQFPEMMGGRVKTLHPKIFGGILGRTTDISDIKAMQEHGIPCIDIIVCNLYPFQEEVAKGDATTHEKIIEKIDVGGPSMIRAAAKNYERVLVVCNPEQYQDMAHKIESGHEFALWERELLARNAFGLTSRYEARIEDYFHIRDVKRRKTIAQ
jgi:phosphoribosylaminoimidazolecarboxamide formyltransferase/IMP cyclohydrolase